MSNAITISGEPQGELQSPAATAAMPQKVAKKRKSSAYYIGEAFAIATLITAAFTIIQQVFIKGAFNPWETAAVFLSFACTWLCTRQVRFNYIVGIFSTSVTAITFYQAGLFGSMALNLYLVPTVIYGWFMWGKDSNPRPVQRTTLKGWAQYAAATAVTWLGAYLLIKAFGGGMAKADGFLLVGSVLAQWMLDRKKLENWIVWAIVNVASIIVYWQAGLHLLALQFAVFFANACIAYVQWKNSMIETNAPEQQESQVK